MNCVKNKLKISSEYSPPSKDGKMQHRALNTPCVRESEVCVASNRLRDVRCAE